MRILISLLLAMPLLAQPPYTTITDTVYTPVAGTIFTGTLQVSLPIPVVTTGAITIGQWNQTIPISNGKLSFRVVPIDALTQNIKYALRFTASAGTPQWTYYCRVLTSVSPVKLADVCDTIPGGPPQGSSAGGILGGTYPDPTCPTCEVTGHKAAASGYASLDSGTKVPVAQIPALPESQITSLVSDLAGKQAALGFTPEDTANRAAVNGYASLDGNTKVPVAQIPALPESQITSLVSDLAGKAASNAATTVNGQACALGSTCTITAAPGAHASTHASIGSDPVTLAESQTTGLVADLAAKVPSSALGVTVASLDGNTTVPQVQMPRCTTVLSFSSTPAIDFATCPNIKITLTGNAAPTVSNQAYCERGCFVTIIQGAANYTWTWSGSVIGGFAIGSVNGGRNSQSFTSDGTSLIATSYGVIDQ